MEKKLMQFDQNVENIDQNIAVRRQNAKTFNDNSPSSLFINYSQRDSLDNNPFDRALKELRLQNDPFEIKTLPPVTNSVSGLKHVQLEKLIDFGPEQQMGTILENPTVVLKQGIEDVSQQTTITEPSADSTPTTPSSSLACPTKGLNYALINHQNLQAIRSPYFGRRGISSTNSKAPASRILSDSGVPDSPTMSKWFHYREPNRSFSTNTNDLTKLLETDGGLSFSEEARKITNRLMMTNDSSNWTFSGNSSFEEIQSIKPPTFTDSDISDLDADFSDMKIPMLDEIKHLEQQRKIEEEKVNNKKTLLDNYNSLKAKAEVQQMQIEQDNVDTAMKTQALVDFQKFKDILLKHKTSELSKDELLAEIETAFELETNGEVASLAKPVGQLTFNVEEASPVVKGTPLLRQATYDVVADDEQTEREDLKTPTNDLEEQFCEQMKELFKTAILLRNGESDPSHLNLENLFIPSKGGDRRSVASSTPVTNSVIKPARLSVNPSKTKMISPMLSKHARMSIKPFQKPAALATNDLKLRSRPIKLKTSPTRAMTVPSKRAPPMIAVHPVPRIEVPRTPLSQRRPSMLPNSSAKPVRAVSTVFDRSDGGRRRSLTAGATANLKTPMSRTVQYTPQANNKLQTTPVKKSALAQVKSAYQATATPSRRMSQLQAPQSCLQAAGTPSRRSLLPSNKAPRTLMSQMTPKPLRRSTSFSAKEQGK